MLESLNKIQERFLYGSQLRGPRGTHKLTYKAKKRIVDDVGLAKQELHRAEAEADGESVSSETSSEESDQDKTPLLLRKLKDQG